VFDEIFFDEVFFDEIVRPASRLAWAASAAPVTDIATPSRSSTVPA
jgi:hypothetical protein